METIKWENANALEIGMLICEELNVSCKRVTWDTDASGTWMEHYKGVDDWILQKEEKEHRKTA